jgi:hypothetical protein
MEGKRKAADLNNKAEGKRNQEEKEKHNEMLF